MDQFKKSNLRELMDHQAQPCLSLFMPTHRAGTELQQNAIRLKNLLSQAEDILSDFGLRRPQVQAFLEPVRDQLLNDSTFWQQPSSGLAVFTAPNLFNHYRLPLEFEETVIVSQQFYIKPLFAYFQKVNRGVSDFLTDEHVPPLLAGVEYLFTGKRTHITC